MMRKESLERYPHETLWDEERARQHKRGAGQEKQREQRAQAVGTRDMLAEYGTANGSLWQEFGISGMGPVGETGGEVNKGQFMNIFECMPGA